MVSSSTYYDYRLSYMCHRLNYTFFVFRRRLLRKGGCPSQTELAGILSSAHLVTLLPSVIYHLFYICILIFFVICGIIAVFRQYIRRDQGNVLSNATDVSLHLLSHIIWGHLCKLRLKRNVMNVTGYTGETFVKGSFCNSCDVFLFGLVSLSLSSGHTQD